MKFENIKVGDRVIIGTRIVSVTKVTEKQFMAGGEKFWKTGRPIGGNYSSDEATPERIARIEARNAELAKQDELRKAEAAKPESRLASQLAGYDSSDWKRLPLSQLEAIAAMMEAAKEGKLMEAVA